MIMGYMKRLAFVDFYNMDANIFKVIYNFHEKMQKRAKRQKVMACQLDLFIDLGREAERIESAKDETYKCDKFEDIKSEVKNVKESSEKVRKSLFAKHGTLERKYAEINERLAILERNICLGAIPTIFQS